MAGLAFGALLGVLPWQSARGQESAGAVRRVVVVSNGWQLVGDLRVPPASHPIPAVLLLNQAAGDRGAYRELADLLAERGIASLRVDLRVDTGRVRISVASNPGGISTTLSSGTPRRT